MIRKILPVLLGVVAFLGGAAAGDMLRAPDPAAAQTPPDGAALSQGEAGDAPPPAVTPSAVAPSAPEAHDQGAGAAKGSGQDKDGKSGEKADGAAWFKFPQQFFVPILHDGQLDSTMILSLSLEMPQAEQETVNAHELKLRDGLLRQLLIHANTGGFDGNFTAEPQLRALKAELLQSAQAIVPAIDDILIEDIARQER